MKAPHRAPVSRISPGARRCRRADARAGAGARSSDCRTRPLVRCRRRGGVAPAVPRTRPAAARSTASARYPAPATADCIERLRIRDLLAAPSRRQMATRRVEIEGESDAGSRRRSSPAAISRRSASERSRVAEAPPVCVYLEVTNRCNLLCETCPRTFEALEPPADMSWQLFTSIVDQLPGLARAVLHGVGEPMLVKNLPRMIRYLKERGVYVLFNTNGTLLAPKKRREIIETGLDELRVSLDAAEARELLQGPRQELLRPHRPQCRRVHRAAKRNRRRDAARLAVADRPQGDGRAASRFCAAGGADRCRRGLSAAPRLRRSRPRAGARTVVAVRKDAARRRRRDCRGAGRSGVRSASRSTRRARPSPASA